MMGKKKTGAYMGGGMAKKKGSMYNKGGMPMVSKGGKKVPAFAADGVGKMNKGGDVKKKETFGQAFKRNRNKFKSSGSAADYTFKHEGKSYNILQKGETKAGVMKKFSAPKKSVRPKLRPDKLIQQRKEASLPKRKTDISANTKKKITSTVRNVMAVEALPQDGPDKTPRKTPPRVANSVRTRDKPVANSGKGGENKPIRKKTRFSTDGTVKGPGQKARPGARAKPISKEANSAKVREGQAKFRDRGAPKQLTLSERHLRMFKNDPSSLDKVQKDRLFKTLKRKGVAIPKGLSGNNPSRLPSNYS